MLKLNEVTITSVVLRIEYVTKNGLGSGVLPYSFPHRLWEKIYANPEKALEAATQGIETAFSMQKAKRKKSK